MQSPNNKHDRDHARKLPPTSSDAVTTSPSALRPETPSAFLTLLSDCLRLGGETIALSFVFMNRYLRYILEDPSATDLLDEHVVLPYLPNREKT